MLFKLIFDAGHYAKHNRSPVVPAYYESEMNWKLQNLLIEEFKKYKNVEIGTTRADQTKDLPVEARGRAAAGYDLLISLHSNAVWNKTLPATHPTNINNEKVDRVCAIWQVPESTLPNLSPISKSVAEKLAKVVAEAMETKDPYKVYSKLSAGDRDQDGKLDDNYYGIMHGARMVGTPCVILEHSFHTNTQSATWLLQDENLKKLAVAEAAAIAELFELELIEEVKPEVPKPTTLYRVQVGAFSVKANASKLEAELKAKGYPTYIAGVGGLYRVQVGAFGVKSNADKMLAKLKADGYNGYITTTSTAASSPAPAPAPKPTPPAPKFIPGKTKVKVIKGSKDYKGKKLSPSVFRKTYDLIQLVGERAVIGIGSSVTCAIKVSNLKIVK